MKTRIYNLAAKAFGALSKSPFVTITLASVLAIVVGVGAWAYTVHTAQIRTEKMVRTEATTLNRVVAKLNAVDSSLQQRSQTLVAKLDALRHANATLAAYALEAGRGGAGLEQNREVTPVAGKGVVGLDGGGWTIKICSDGLSKLAGYLKERLQGRAGVKGGLGLDWAKNGAAGILKAAFKVLGGIKEKGAIEMDMKVCTPELFFRPRNIFAALPQHEGGQGGIQAAAFTSVGGNFPMNTRPSGNDRSTGLGNNMQLVGLQSGLNTTLKTVGQEVAAQMAIFLQNHPRAVTILPKGIQALNNFHQTLSSSSLLNLIKNPKQAFSAAHEALTALPLSGNLAKVMADPRSFLPKLSDLSPANVCSNANNNGAPDFLLTLCSSYRIPGFDNMNAIHSSVSRLAQIPNRLDHLRTDLTNFCHTIDKRIKHIIFSNKMNCNIFSGM